MDIYVIYSFEDKTKVDAVLKDIKSKDKEGALHFFMFSPFNENQFWHKTAVDKLKKCNLVCYFCDLNKKLIANRLKNVKWELGVANKFNKKTFIIRLDEELPQAKCQSNSIAQEIFGLDYSGELLNLSRYRVCDTNEITDILLEESQWTVEKSLINIDLQKDINEFEYYQLLISEYQIMVDTSEKLMERRQNISNLYTSICAALLAFIGAAFAFGNLTATFVIMLLAGLVFTSLALNWKACLRAYEMNNAGKFAVINAIEKILPANMFDCEYRYNTKNGIKSYSNRERLLPHIFVIVGISLIALSLVMLVLTLTGVVSVKPNPITL